MTNEEIKNEIIQEFWQKYSRNNPSLFNVQTELINIEALEKTILDLFEQYNNPAR